jgi:hypothetical protein
MQPVIQTIRTITPEARPSHKWSHLFILVKRESLLFFFGLEILFEDVIVLICVILLIE